MTVDTVEVICTGPPDAPHDRRVIRRYMRIPVDPPEWHWMPPTGQALDDLDAGDWPVHGKAIRLRCRDCRLDEKRSLGRDYGRDYPAFSAVFEKLRRAGVAEVSARGLITLVWAP